MFEVILSVVGERGTGTGSAMCRSLKRAKEHAFDLAWKRYVATGSTGIGIEWATIKKDGAVILNEEVNTGCLTGTFERYE